LFSLIHPESEENFNDGDSAIETEDSLQYLHSDTAHAHDLSGISLNVDDRLSTARTSQRSYRVSFFSFKIFLIYFV